MAIGTGSLLEIALGMTFAGSRMFNVFHYRVVGEFGPSAAVQVGESWWNHVKDEYRTLAQSSFGAVFDSVRVLELVTVGGAYGEYPVPTAERAGTRPTTPEPQALPTFNAVGVRLTVGTRATRPGQKRITFMTEADAVANSVEAGFYGAVQTLFDVLTSEMVLGDPTVGMSIQPIVVRRGTGVSVLASQDVTGYLVNPYITSQVSRKFGRGM